MKKIVIIISTVFISLFGYSENNIDDLLLGLKDNQYGVLGYRYSNYQLGIKQSIFTENIRDQYIQLNAGYYFSYKNNFRFSAFMEGGTAYSGAFYNLGLNLTGEYVLPVSFLSLSFEVEPYYDSGFDYTTCYGFTGKCDITKEISFKLKFTNIPEFRMPERRLRTGFIFESKNLCVEPEISFPIEDKPRYTRLLCSFTYRIKIR